jgi:divalent metal cation (Fe/Co/Zn/Cd) transporter
MLAIVLVKLFLLWICQRGGYKRVVYVQKGEYHSVSSKAVVQLADPTIEALAQDHFNDALSNSVAAVALLFALKDPNLWFLDPIGAVIISVYIIYSWYQTGLEQIQHLTGRAAPEEFIEELHGMASSYDDRVQVDTIRAYHFGPKFLVELEVVMPPETLLFESHDVGMELQYEIESREEVERCFVHIDYETRPYDEHVVSKVPELRERYRPKRSGSVQSL